MADVETLDDILNDLGDCQRCNLCRDRENIVFGAGKGDADIMIVGEAPGANEDESGRPFVGKAGGLLTKLLAKLEVDRDDVYIANVVKCRPPSNRDPKRDEIAACSPFLERQIGAVQPKVIIALGRFSANHLARQFSLSMRSMREEEWTDAPGLDGADLPPVLAAPPARREEGSRTP